jgi:hypothetical protein
MDMVVQIPEDVLRKLDSEKKEKENEWNKKMDTSRNFVWKQNRKWTIYLCWLVVSKFDL